MHKYDNAIIWDQLSLSQDLKTRRTSDWHGEDSQTKVEPETRYRSYKDWQKLSSEQRMAIIKAREVTPNRSHTGEVNVKKKWQQPHQQTQRGTP